MRNLAPEWVMIGVPTARHVRKRELTHLSASTQHPTCEESIIRVGFKGEDVIGDVGECIGEKANVCTDVDRNTAARHQLGKHPQFGLAGAFLPLDPLPIENRWWQ